MCVLAALPALATAGGATGAAAAGGATLAGTLQTIGAITAIGGSLYSGYAGKQQAKANIAAVENQKIAEKELNAVEAQRTRREYASRIRTQAAELAARGIALDSPTALLLGQTAAQEASYAVQGVRQSGDAKQQELTATQKSLRAQGSMDMLRGVTGAAGSLLNAAPQLWPELGR